MKQRITHIMMMQPMMQLQVICGLLEAGGHTDVSEGKIQCFSFAYQA